MKSKQMALPPSKSPEKPLALPPVIDQKPQAETTAMPNARQYNELMDAYSLHQLIIRKG